MHVHIKLMGSLRSKLPPEAQKGVTTVDLGPQMTIADLLQRFNIGLDQVHAVMVNDEMELDRQRALADGDRLVVLPPVAGG